MPLHDSRLGNTMFRLTVALVSVLALAGCVHHGAVHLHSEPSGAEVVSLDDNTVLGVTPVKVWYREPSSRRKYVSVRFQKPGYDDRVTAFWVHMRHRSRDAAMNEAAPIRVELQPSEGAQQ